MTLSKLSNHWPAGVAGLFLFLLYLTTLQTHINGSSHDYLIDVGEIQVALNVEGTIHYTGYPLFTIFSTWLTQFFRLGGVNPAAAASASALVWSLLALGFTYHLFARLTSAPLLSALAVTALGVTEAYWMHSIIAEVYSFSFLLMALAFWLAHQLQQKWQTREVFLLVLVCGVGVSHHRLWLFLLPCIGLLLLPAGWQWLKKRPVSHLFSLVVTFLLPFVAYLYLPLKAWQKNPWVYGQPGQWAGFWLQFTGGEVTEGLIRWPSSAAEWVDNGYFVWGHLTQQWPAVLLGLSLLALGGLVYHQPAWGVSCAGGIMAYVGFVWAFPPAVWAPATLMPAVWFLALALVWAVSHWTQPKWLAVVAAGVWVVVIGYLGQKNLDPIQNWVNDPAGQEMITKLEPLTHHPQQEQMVVVLPWGTNYFAAAFGRYVTRELQNLTIVDHRADFTALLNEGKIIVTPTSYNSYWSKDWWQERVGEPLQSNLVAAGLVGLSHQPLPTSLLPEPVFNLENGLIIQKTELKQSHTTINLVLFLEATQPITQNYSVAIHLLTQAPPTGPADIVAQADAVHPLNGWLPTTQWPLHTTLRDEYQLVIPAGSQPTQVGVAMYYQTPEGVFVNTPWLYLPITR